MNVDWPLLETATFRSLTFAHVFSFNYSKQYDPRIVCQHLYDMEINSTI